MGKSEIHATVNERCADVEIMLLKKNAFQTGRGKEKQQRGIKRGARESLEGN
jgi:hypothetical protein